MGECFMLHRVTQRIPKFTYTGSYQLIDDGNGNWRIKFKTSGTLTFQNLGNARKGIDVFLVGGGGGGVRYTWQSNGQHADAGGGAGYTTTVKDGSVKPVKGTSYSIVIGSGGAGNSGMSGGSGSKTADDGQASTAFGKTAAGGKGAKAGWHYDQYTPAYNYFSGYGGDGGSGGGIGIASYNQTADYPGGTNGGNGTNNGRQTQQSAGTGQGSTTKEFGENGGTTYAQGGGSNTTAAANTGNGGLCAETGSSGIVVIRNHR